MKFKKFITAFFLICLSTLCFFGCANIESFRTVTYDEEGNGIIIDKMVVTLDKKELGSSYESVKTSIYEDMVSFRNYVDAWIDSFKIQYKDEYLRLFENIKCEVLPSSDNMLTTSLTFYDANSFAMFYGIVDVEEGVNSQAMADIGPFLSSILKGEYGSEKMGLFLHKYAVINSKSIVDIIPEFKIDEIGTNYYEKYSQMTGFNLHDVNVSQVFVYPTETFAYVDDKVHNNADVIEEVDGYTFLAWDLSEKEEGFQVSLYKLYPITIAWYVLGLILSIIFVIVVFVVITLKHKDKVKIKITKAEAEKDGR